jgi:hypothetical protein
VYLIKVIAAGVWLVWHICDRRDESTCMNPLIGTVSRPANIRSKFVHARDNAADKNKQCTYPQSIVCVSSKEWVNFE